MAESFSERMGYKQPPDKLVHGDAPKPVREGLIWVIGRVCEEALPKEMNFLHGDLLADVARYVDVNYRKNLDWDAFCKLTLTCPWYEFYDLCECVYLAFLDMVGTGKDLGRMAGTKKREFLFEDFEKELNRLFQDQGIAYRMNGMQIEPFGSQVTREVVQKVRSLLQAPEFAGPDAQFEKAIAFLSKRPEPDTENCVKDAVGAVEAIARIIADDEKAILPDILKREPFKSGIHSTLKLAIEKIYAYRGDVPGAAHGQVGPSAVTVHEAEWVLLICASTILYFVNKFSGKTT